MIADTTFSCLPVTNLPIPFTVPGPVTDFKLLNRAFTTLTLVWQLPPVPNGVIVLYQLTEGSFPPNNLSAAFAVAGELDVATAYTFTLVAWTIAGPGQPAILKATTASVREYKLKVSLMVCQLSFPQQMLLM